MSFVSKEEAEAFVAPTYSMKDGKKSSLLYQHTSGIINKFGNAAGDGASNDARDIIAPSQRTEDTTYVIIPGLRLLSVGITREIEGLVDGQPIEIKKSKVEAFLCRIDSLLNGDNEIAKEYMVVVEKTAEIFGLDMTKIRPSLAQVREMGGTVQRESFTSV